MKRKKSRFGILVVVLIVLVAFFCPKPLVRNIEESDIISVIYQADTWESLHFFYPTPAVPSIDEGELLRILNQSKAVVEVFSLTGIDGTPVDTLMITVSDGGSIKTINLGDWNRVTIQDGFLTYQIIDADSVLNKVLDFLQIKEYTDEKIFLPNQNHPGVSA